MYPTPKFSKCESTSGKNIGMQGKFQNQTYHKTIKRSTFWIGLVPSTTFTFCRYSSIIAFLLSFLYVTLSTETKRNKKK